MHAAFVASIGKFQNQAVKNMVVSHKLPYFQLWVLGRISSLLDGHGFRNGQVTMRGVTFLAYQV
jgi:hypothetical protein